MLLFQDLVLYFCLIQVEETDGLIQLLIICPQIEATIRWLFPDAKILWILSDVYGLILGALQS